MAKGFFSTQEGHWVPLLFPVDETGGKTSAGFSMEKYGHASIAVLIGVSAAAPGLVTLNACSDTGGDGATAIPFIVYKCETGSSDVLGTKVSVPSTGFTPVATDNIFYVIEIDSDALPAGLPYLQLAMANTSNSVIAAAVALLSGARQACDQSPTVLA